MASQDEGGVPVTFSYAQQEYRLLELPAKVVESIAANGNIKCATPLQLLVCTLTWY